MKLTDRTMRRFFPEAKADQGSKREWRVNCPGKHRSGPDRQQSLYVNLRRGVCHCFACGYSPSVATLARKVGATGSASEGPIRRAFEFPAKRIKRIAYDLPPSYRRLRRETKSRTARKALGYLLGRGVTWKQIRRHRLGYATKGNVSDCVILPIVENGALVYWQARRYVEHERRYYFPPGDREGIVFNWDHAKRHDEIVLVEGIFDALAIGENGLALLSKELSSSVLLRLCMLERRTFVVLLDGGEDEGALKIAKQLFDAGLHVKLATLPEGEDPSKLAQRDKRELEFHLASAQEVTLASLILGFSALDLGGF